MVDFRDIDFAEVETLVFVEELKKTLRDFNLVEAEKLTMLLHEAESSGHILSSEEEHLWGRLTIRIEEEYSGLEPSTGIRI